MLQGVFSVLPTPFTSDQQIDTESLKKVIDLYLHAGINGLTAAGVTSEVARLTPSERSLVLETVMHHVDGKVPVIIGTSAEGTQNCIELSKKAELLKASAVMVSPPRMPKLNSLSVLDHYRALAGAMSLPIIVQDFPPVSGFTMEPSLLAQIAREIPSVRGIKLEDPPTPLKIRKVLELASKPDLEIVGGLGGTYLFEELMAGGVGAMTGFAIPEILVRVVRLFHDGRREESSEIFYRAVAMMRFEFQEGIGMAIRKEVLRRRGAIKSAMTRSPGVQIIDDTTQRSLDSMLKWFLNNFRDFQWTLD